jgi:hypothetical protein
VSTWDQTFGFSDTAVKCLTDNNGRRLLFLSADLDFKKTFPINIIQLILPFQGPAIENFVSITTILIRTTLSLITVVKSFEVQAPGKAISVG